jgi:hypothetical protein
MKKITATQAPKKIANHSHNVRGLPKGITEPGSFHHGRND